MSFFAVTLETIATSEPIPNTERLDITSLVGMSFRFVTARGKHKPGDRVLYFPLDAVIPQEVLRKMGLEGKLGGAEKNRLHTMILRGFPSQGLVEFPEVLLPPGFESLTPEEITKALGVTKYEMEPEPCKGGTLVSLPHGLSTFDIEGADRFQDVMAVLMDELVVVTEKAEGCNFSAGVTAEGRPFVNQRVRSIVENPGEKNRYWEMARQHRLIDAAILIQAEKTVDRVTPLVSIYAELLGPGLEVKNYYGFRANRLLGFGVRIDYGFASRTEYQLLLGKHAPSLELVPVISQGLTLREWLKGRTLVEASHGKSMINPDKLREGVVIEPAFPRRHDRIGRLILKQRDPLYLAKTGN